MPPQLAPRLAVQLSPNALKKSSIVWLSAEAEGDSLELGETGGWS